VQDGGQGRGRGAKGLMGRGRKFCREDRDKTERQKGRETEKRNAPFQSGEGVELEEKPQARAGKLMEKRKPETKRTSRGGRGTRHHEEE